MIDLSIVIVNYNNKTLLKNCLASIFSNKGAVNLEVFVVDNASTDQSSEMVQKYFPQTRLIKNNKNLYYSKANNQGLTLISGKYFLVLNEDTTIPKNTFSGMIKFLKDRPSCGIASCQEIDAKGKTLLTCHKFHHPVYQILELPLFYKVFKNSSILKNFHYNNWDRKSTRQVDTIPGSFIFGKSELLKKVGNFDEKLVHFYSDADFCQRVFDAGYKIYHVGNITINHLSAATFVQFSQTQIIRQAYQDMVYYYQKHFGIFWAMLIFLLTRIHLVYYWLLDLFSYKFASKNI